MVQFFRSALRRAACVLLATLGALGAHAPAAAQCESDFIPGQGFRGVRLLSLALLNWDPDGAGPLEEVLVSSGGGGYAGHVRTPGVAIWNGDEWSTLGGGIDVSTQALVEYQGDLIIAGYALEPQVPVNRWDGLTWTQMPGIGIYVESLAVFKGELYAGGSFEIKFGSTASFFAKWDGAGWIPVSGSPNGPINALFVYNGELVAGGAFTAAGGGSANRIARFDGASWSPIGAGISGGTGVSPGPRVNALGEYNGELIVGGNFNTAGATAANNIARWNGTAWSAFPGEGIWSPSTADVHVFTTYDGDLIVGGKFVRANGVITRNIGRWDGTAWSELDLGVSAPSSGGVVYGLAVYDGRLYVAGDIQGAGNLPLTGVAAWDGDAWSHLGDGIVGRFRSFTTYNNELVGGGDITAIDDDYTVHQLARWNGTAWRKLDILFHGGVIAEVNTHQGDLIVTGGFIQAGAVVTRGIARWDGSDWHSFGSGLDGNAGPVIEYNGDLIVGGNFDQAGPLTVANIARWDGTQWHALGAGVGTRFSAVRDMIIYNGDLIVSGDFTTVGGIPARGVARWDGTQWHALGAGLIPTFGSQSDGGQMIIDNGDLVVVGNFDIAGSTPAANIARWDGSQWHAFGDGLTNSPSGSAASIVRYSGDLIVSGDFTTAGGVLARYIARWDGSAWGPLAPDIAQAIFPIDALYVFNGDLFGITVAATARDGRISAGYFRWHDCCIADFNGDTVANSQDFFDFLTAFFALKPAADFNGDEVVNSQDFFDFLSAFFAGCA